MRVRGERTCRDCGATWSYFETGSVTCPECGSVRSTGHGDRERHTDRDATLDLTEPRATAADGDIEAALATAADVCLEYLRRRGFIDAGELRTLDEEYVYAQELRHAATIASSRLELTDDERSYLLRLLESDPDTRPPGETVPDGLRAARGLAVATAVRDYIDDLRTWQDESPDRPDERAPIEPLADHRRRIRALDGEVPPDQADDLITAARAVGRYCRDNDENALATATSTLESLGQF
jgi:uncharacterized Zn finger protein (UPF0148 family)